MIALGKITNIDTECQNGMCYFSFTTADLNMIACNNGESRVKCYYVSKRVFPGMIANLTGFFNSSGVFCVRDIIPSLRYEADLINLMSKSVRGVGKQKAKGLISALFGDIPDIPGKEQKLMTMEPDDARDLMRTKYPALSLHVANRICDFLCIRERLVREVEDELLPYRVPYDVIDRICYDFGPDAVDTVKHHPYSLVKSGLHLWIAEDIGKKTDVPEYSKERVRGIIHFVMRRAMQKGYSRVSYQQLVDKVNYYSRRYAYASPIAEILILNVAGRDGTFVHNEKGLSYRTVFEAERSIGLDCNIIAGNDKNVRRKGIQLRDDRIEDGDIEKVEKHLGVKYSPSQRKAFALVEKPGISILTGGPGTGKTTVVKGLISWFKHKHPDLKVALCAPSGRAAKRLSESAGMKASTIHKLLDYCPFNGGNEAQYKRRDSDPVEADLVIVDECSMVDAPLFSMLLGAIKPGATVLVCGDEDQLASVGPGNVLHDLIECREFPCCRLTENHRQDDDGTIINNAKRVLDGQKPVEGKNFHLIRTFSEQEAFKKVTGLAKKLYDNKKPFDTQVIEPSYKGEAGVNAVNKEMRRYFGRDLKKKVSKGDKVMFTRTSYKDGYVNGQLGTVVADSDEGIVVKSDGRRIAVRNSSLVDITPAYSFTIHKAQGSEADTVIICLPADNPKMLQKNLLYTAITRAKKEVYIVYVGDALSSAVENDEDSRRKTRLSWLIQCAFAGKFISTRHECRASYYEN